MTKRLFGLRLVLIEQDRDLNVHELGRGEIREIEAPDEQAARKLLEETEHLLNEAVDFVDAPAVDKPLSVKIKPDPKCEFCHGSGEVFDSVNRPFAPGYTSMPSLCSCVEERVPEGYEDATVELDLSDYKEPVWYPDSPTEEMPSKDQWFSLTLELRKHSSKGLDSLVSASKHELLEEWDEQFARDAYDQLECLMDPGWLWEAVAEARIDAQMLADMEADKAGEEDNE